MISKNIKDKIIKLLIEFLFDKIKFKNPLLKRKKRKTKTVIKSETNTTLLIKEKLRAFE